MVIGDLNRIGIPVTPGETNSELIIDPNAVLTLSVPKERLKVVARRYPEVFQVSRVIHHHQFSQRHVANIRRRHTIVLACRPELFCCFAGDVVSMCLRNKSSRKTFR
jgi:hypothetical protein